MVRHKIIIIRGAPVEEKVGVGVKHDMKLFLPGHFI